MDQLANDTEVLSGERSTGDSGVLIISPPWTVRELQLTIDKGNWIWNQISKFKVIFSDFTRGDPNNFRALLQDPFTYWLEVLNADGGTVGLIYLTGLHEIVDAQVHLLFFDRKPAEKLDLCKIVARHLFIRFPYLHRLTASMPEMHYNTIRLAKKIGFREEGKRREVRLIGRQWVNEVVLGLLASEALSGSNTK